MDRRRDRVAAVLATALPRSGSHPTVPLIRRVRRMLHDPDTVVHECRHCGTTLESAADTCPVCDADDVVRYVIE